MCKHALRFSNRKLAEAHKGVSAIFLSSCYLGWDGIDSLQYWKGLNEPAKDALGFLVEQQIQAL